MMNLNYKTAKINLRLLRYAFLPALFFLFSCDEKKGEIIGATIELLAESKEHLKANGKDEVLFTVKSLDETAAGEAEIYYMYGDGKEAVKLSGRRFTTQRAGKYTFYAIYGKNLKSKSLQIEFAERELKIISEKAAIRANGSEKTKFTILLDGEELLSGYEILVSDNEGRSYEKIDGSEFHATTAGEYWFIAKYHDIQTEPLVVSVQNTVLLLSVDKASLIANGVNKAVFTLRQDGDTVVDYILYHKKESENDFTPLPAKEYVFSEHGEHVFKAVKGQNSSNRVTVSATKSVLMLQADKNTITADNTDEVVFSVSQDNEKLSNGYQIMVKKPSTSVFTNHTGDRFKTGDAGDYTFVVERNGLRSDEIAVKAVLKTGVNPQDDEKPVLRADKHTLVSDGRDKIVFSVILNGADVTDAYDVYRLAELNNEIKVSGNAFRTQKEGDYLFFAQERGTSDAKKKKTDYIRIKAEKPMGAIPNGRVFVRNTTLTSGWHDVDKFFGPRDAQGKGGDGVLCWAASASNMIQWWLEDYQRKGYEIPEGTPFGKGKIYELAIFEEYMRHWKNNQGVAMAGIQFFFVAPDLNEYSTMMNLENKNFVGFFKRSSQWENVKDFFSGYGRDDSYVKSYGAYNEWHKKQGIRSFTDLILKLLDDGAVSLGIGGHEVSVWGIDLKDGLADYIYITNSDDKVKRLHKIKLYAVNNDVYFSELIAGAAGNRNNGEGKRIDKLTGLKAYDR